MAKTLVAAAVVLVSALALGEEKAALQPLAPAAAPQLYQIELVPSGKLVSQDLPVLKGTTYLFHQYPSGTLISVRKSTVKQISKMSPTAVAAANPTATKRIGNLAMQGPRSDGTGGRPSNMGRARAAVEAANAGTAGRTTSPY
jgi:hypothetical protein